MFCWDTPTTSLLNDFGALDGSIDLFVNKIWCSLLQSDWFVLMLCQIKEDTKRPVYCALIRLLQDKDLSVRVYSFSNVVFSFGFPAAVCGYFPWLLINSLLFMFQLAACRSLCSHIEDASFSEGEFVDLLPICWDSSFRLIEKVQEFDSKVNITATSLGGNDSTKYFCMCW